MDEIMILKCSMDRLDKRFEQAAVLLMRLEKILEQVVSPLPNLRASSLSVSTLLCLAF